MSWRQNLIFEIVISFMVIEEVFKRPTAALTYLWQGVAIDCFCCVCLSELVMLCVCVLKASCVCTWGV